MIELKEFTGYAENVYDFLVLAEIYWPITLIIAMYFTVFKTWNYYLALTHLNKLKEDKGFTLGQKIFAYPQLVIGLAWDVFLNFFVGSIIFLEPPRYDLKEILFTGRVSRWNDTGGWRGDLARWFCRVFLDPFEEGGHCI